MRTTHAEKLALLSMSAAKKDDIGVIFRKRAT